MSIISMLRVRTPQLTTVVSTIAYDVTLRQTLRCVDCVNNGPSLSTFRYKFVSNVLNNLHLPHRELLSANKKQVQCALHLYLPGRKLHSASRYYAQDPVLFTCTSLAGNSTQSGGPRPYACLCSFLAVNTSQVCVSF